MLYEDWLSQKFVNLIASQWQVMSFIDYTEK